VKSNKLDQVKLLNKAVGEKEGIMEFYKDTVTGGRMSSLLRKHTGKHFEGRTERVAVTTLAALIEAYGVPNLVKLDTEGAETMIFASMASLPITTTYFVEVRDETAREIFTKFSKQGFSIVSLDHQMKLIQSESDLIGFDNWLIKHE
jgi:FkbM family methyltransferase